jgi:hypothetical protein
MIMFVHQMDSVNLIVKKLFEFVEVQVLFVCLLVNQHCMFFKVQVLPVNLLVN